MRNIAIEEDNLAQRDIITYNVRDISMYWSCEPLRANLRLSEC